MADAADPLKPQVPVEGGVPPCAEARDGLPPVDGLIDLDDDFADDPDPFVVFWEWADEIDDADFADL